MATQIRGKRICHKISCKLDWVSWLAIAWNAWSGVKQTSPTQTLTRMAAISSIANTKKRDMIEIKLPPAWVKIERICVHASCLPRDGLEAFRNLK
jgi:hypothetical protein